MENRPARKYLIFVSLFLLLFFLGLSVVNIYYLQKAQKSKTRSNNQPVVITEKGINKTLGEYLVVSKLSIYYSPDEKSYRSYLIPGKKFSLIKEEAGWGLIEVYERRFDVSWSGWIKIDPAFYKKFDEVGQ